ncbi:hypothetical protein AB0056_26595, partial [Klebsiella pneumoniae]
GLTQYVVQGNRLGTVGQKPRKSTEPTKDQNEKLHEQEREFEPGHQVQFSQHNSSEKLVSDSSLSLTSDEWKKLGAIGLLFFFQILFWAVYEQGG